MNFVNSQIAFLLNYSTLSASETKEFVEDGEIDFDSDVMETETSSPKEIVSVPIVPSLEQNNIKTRKIKRKTKTHKRKVSLYNFN